MPPATELNRCGVIVVDKPGGMTSAKVVAKVKRALGVSKVGHTGTLDPMATGVLPLCIGEGTKIAGYLLAEDKAYEGEFVLGVETDTLDREGSITQEHRELGDAISEGQLLTAMQKFEGPLEQVPPMYSALKQGGRRLHQLARAGVEVERPARAVTIENFRLLSFEAPVARFAVSCSKGTYVRSLVSDLGRELGCGAHLSELRRTQSGRFGLDEAISLDDLEQGIESPAVIDPAEALSHLPAVRIPAERLEEVSNGKILPWSAISDLEPPLGPVVARKPDGNGLVAIIEIVRDKICYRRVFTYALTRGL